MNPEAQQIAIAEACSVNPKLSWQVLNDDESASCLSGSKAECEKWLSDMKRKFPDSHYSKYHVGTWKIYPDFLNDLNAMHEAEKVMNHEQFQEYIGQLYRIVHGNNVFSPIHATAAQRSEAFLRTLGLWKE